MIVDHCPALDNLSLTMHRVFTEENNNLNVRWPRVAPSCPSPVLGFGKTWS